jgi:hypothetical protein
MERACNRPNWMESDGQLEVVRNFAEVCSASILVKIRI